MKQKIREDVAALKLNYSNKQLMQFSEDIFRKLEMTKAFADARYILAYYSLPGEVVTHDFIDKYSKEKTIILPVVQKDVLVLKEFEGTKSMQKSVYGIMEPTGNEFVDFPKIDLAIVPGVAFDRNLNRLGRGKAYYDSLLPKLTAYLIGVCFSFQIREKVPVESHDFPMDCVISQNETLL